MAKEYFLTSPQGCIFAHIVQGGGSGPPVVHVRVCVSSRRRREEVSLGKNKSPHTWYRTVVRGVYQFIHIYSSAKTGPGGRNNY